MGAPTVLPRPSHAGLDYSRFDGIDCSDSENEFEQFKTESGVTDDMLREAFASGASSDDAVDGLSSHKQLIEEEPAG